MEPVFSPKELALAIGVSESSLKRWADDGLIQASRTAGGHRRITLTEVIRFIRDNQADLVRPDVLRLPDLARVALDLPAPGEEGDCLAGHLTAGRAGESRGLILWLYLSGWEVAAICDGPLKDAFEVLGKLWLGQKDGVFLEHRATDIVIQSLSQLRSVVPRPSPPVPVAVGGGIAGDPYILPPLMAALALAAEGFESVSLGPDSPADALAQAARHHDARLVWLNISAEQNPAQLQGYVESLIDRLATLGLSLIVGGRARHLVRLPASPRLHLGSSMAELTAFAKGCALA